MQSAVLWRLPREADLAFPPLLYFNQFVNAVVKLVCMVRLSKQRWANRGDQCAGFDGSLVDLMQIAAGYIMTVSLAGLVLLVVVFADRAFPPTIYTVSTLLGRF